MSASTITAGYPVHRVTRYARWTNQHGAQFTDWRAACGHTDTMSGHRFTGRAGQARRLELCRTRFPDGHRGIWADPGARQSRGGEACQLSCTCTRRS